MATAATTSVQSHLKRKQSAAGISTSGRNVKRRASKACHCCRSRKVRCDVVESGIPCTNCRLDEVECLVTEGKRRRKSYVDGDLLHHQHSPAPSVEGEKDLPTFPIFDDIDGLNDISAYLDGMGGEPNLASLEEGLHHHRPHMLCKNLPCLTSSQTDFLNRSNSRSPYEPTRAHPPHVCYQPEYQDGPPSVPIHHNTP